MAAPTLQAEGTISAVTTGAPTPAIPTHQANDILLARAIFWGPNTAGDAAQIPTPTGSVTWTLIGSQIGQPAGTRDGWLAWWWARADSSGETITFTGGASWDTGTDTCFGAVVDVIRGCATSGNPWDATAQGGPHTAANQSIPAVTVSGSERTVLMAVNSTDNTTIGSLSGWTAQATRADATGTDCAFKNYLQSNVSSSTSADTPTIVAPAQGAYGFTGISFAPEAAAPSDDVIMAPPMIAGHR